MSYSDLTIPALVIISLAVFTMTVLLVLLDGPFEIFQTLRYYLRQNSFTRELIACPWCTSIWVAAVFAFMMTHQLDMTWATIALGGSGGAMVIWRFVFGPFTDKRQGNG